MKILYWDRTGFALWIKKLDREHFRWPRLNEESSSVISMTDLELLLNGGDIQKIKLHKTLHYETLS